MSKDAASNGGGDFRDRSLAAVISAALHVVAFGSIWFVGDQAGWGKSEAQAHSGSDGMSASFIAVDEFRQRIQTKPNLATPEVIATSEETLESVPSTPTEAAVDLPTGTEPADPSAYPASGERAGQENETAPADSMEAGLAQGEDNTGGNNDDDLRAAYLAALRTAIHQHWNYRESPQQCTLTIKQSPGGAVQSAITGECALAPPDRRALEAAALMAQPLPYAGFESIYAESIDLDI